MAKRVKQQFVIKITAQVEVTASITVEAYDLNGAINIAENRFESTLMVELGRDFEEELYEIDAIECTEIEQ